MEVDEEFQPRGINRRRGNPQFNLPFVSSLHPLLTLGWAKVCDQDTKREAFAAAWALGSEQKGPKPPPPLLEPLHEVDGLQLFRKLVYELRLLSGKVFAR